MLQILVDAYQRRNENMRMADDLRQQLMIQEGTDQYRHESHPEYFEVRYKANGVILDETWAKLRDILGEEDFKKLDKYVDHEFATRFPASLRGKLAPSPNQEKSVDFPPIVSYEFFIQHVAAEDARVQSSILNGATNVPRQNYGLAAHFPAEEEDRVLAIVNEGNRKLVENDQHMQQIVREAEEQYGLIQARSMPIPADLQENHHQHQQIITDTMNQLKQELGTDYFKNLDSWIKRRWGHGGVIGGASSQHGTQPSTQEVHP